jgi:hypothetical protein
MTPHHIRLDLTSPSTPSHWLRNAPPWLNFLSHGLNSTAVGMVFGNVLINASRGTSLWEPSAILTGAMYGGAELYVAAVLIYLAKRRFGARYRNRSME